MASSNHENINNGPDNVEQLIAGLSINKRGLLVTLFRMNLDTGRPALATLSHQATGLLREFDAVTREVQAGRHEMAAPPSFTPAHVAEMNGVASGLISAHLGLLRVQCANAASSLVITIDNGVRELAAKAKRKAHEIAGGAKAQDVTLLEAFRAVGDWSRHHYDWKANDSNHWPVQKLTQLGLDVADAVLPARLFGVYNFDTYSDLEAATMDAVRTLAFDWLGETPVSE